MGRVNPDQSRLTPIEQLVRTEWIEPVSNPELELPPDEIDWTKNLPYRFKFKLQLTEDFKTAISVQGNTIAYLDQDGTLRGFNAYSGLNHFSIPMKATVVLGQIEAQKKLYLLDRTSTGALRVSCLDLASPSLLWQRLIPGSKDGALSFDSESQSIVVATGKTGIWSLKASTGEVLWKRPELYSKNRVISSQKHLVVFEPVIAGKAGSWYFLDGMTGKTIQKIPHVYPDVQNLSPFESDLAAPLTFMGRVDAENYFYLNHADLSQLWTFKAAENIKLTRILDQDRYFILYESNLLELRTLKDNTLIYQKKLTGVDPRFIKPSPTKELIAIPSQQGDELAGISFFLANTGDYQVTAHTTEAIQDLLFFGDWLYLFSENHLWAFKK